MSTIQISSGVKRSRTSAPTALAALLAVGMAAVGSRLLRQLPKRRNPTSSSSWETTSVGCSRASIMAA